MPGFLEIYPMGLGGLGTVGTKITTHFISAVDAIHGSVTGLVHPNIIPSTDPTTRETPVPVHGPQLPRGHRCDEV